MKKWEDSLKMTLENQKCYCSTNQGLFIPNRQLSMIVALLLLVVFSVFMTGYFFGKKNEVEQFTQRIQQQACADQIYTNLITSEQNQSPVHDLPAISIDTMLLTESINQDNEDVLGKKQSDSYYAQLIGFGTEKSAHLFVKKLAKRGIETEVKKHASKTVKGQVSYWYQVVTAAYTNKDDLSVIVDKLVKEENIKGASICRC